MLMFFVVPCRLWMISAFVCCVDCTMLVLPWEYRPSWWLFDSAGHMGGFFSGLLMWRFGRLGPRRLWAGMRA